MTMMEFENSFFDRKSILELLKRRVIDLKEGYRQNIAFLGDKFIGKSSIVHKFMSELDDEGVIQIYLDLENKDFNYLFTKFAGSILYEFSRMRKLNLYDDINLLLENTRKLIPQTVEEVKRIQAVILKGRLSEAYRDLIALPEIFTLETGKFCVIMLDEFHNLEELMIPNVFQELGKKIMTQKKCLYIVTSSFKNVAKEILTEKLSLLFGNFEVIYVTPFDLKTSQDFLGQNLQGVHMNDPLKNFLIDFTGGHPFYLRILCGEILRLCALHNQKEVFLPLLTQAVENTIFSRWGVLSRHFEITTSQLYGQKGNRLILGILIALANGKHKLKEVAEEMKQKQNLVSSKINRLIDIGLVVKNGNYFYLHDKLLKYWIKYVLQKRLKAIDSSADHQRLRFRDEIEFLVYNFQKVSEKDLPSRIIELLHCFDNGTFHLNGRRYSLPLFKEITPVKLKNALPGTELIRASCQEGLWFIVLKENNLSEGDVNIFLNESKKMQEKPFRKIIISLNELDVNARLKALQEKIWIWNEGELNTLLSLYDKPYIVK